MTSEELGPRGGWEAAESSRKARPGQIVVVDGKGREIAPRRLLWTNLKTAGPLVVGSAALSALLGGGVAGALAAGAGVLVWVGFLMSRLQPYYAAHARLLRGDLDGAEAEIHALRPPGRGVRAAHAASTLGWVAFARGDTTRAAALFERVLALAGRNAVLRLQAQIGLADVLARTGDLGRARAIRDSIVLPPSSSPIFVVSRDGLELAFALVEHTESAVDEELLDRCERLALELEHTASILAKLARVRAARGDDALADHLAREARERFSWCPMSYWTEVDAWLTDRLARAIPDADDV